MKLTAYLFDFDGTLAPNLDLPDMRKQVIRLTQLNQVPDEIFADQYIVEIIDVCRDWLSLTHNSAIAESYFQQAHQLITDIELAAAAGTAPFPGVRAFLKKLQHAGMQLGVVTRNCRAAVLNVFPDLLDHVDALHARDDVTFLKPDVRHLQACLEKLNVPPHKAAMVGDGGLDMQAGAELNMYCIGVLTGSADEARLREAGAHQVLPSCLHLKVHQFP